MSCVTTTPRSALAIDAAIAARCDTLNVVVEDATDLTDELRHLRSARPKKSYMHRDYIQARVEVSETSDRCSVRKRCHCCQERSRDHQFVGRRCNFVTLDELRIRSTKNGICVSPCWCSFPRNFLVTKSRRRCGWSFPSWAVSVFSRCDAEQRKASQKYLPKRNCCVGPSFSLKFKVCSRAINHVALD